ncbi:hypothetical protein ABIE35_002760 [Paenarthrobacter sp. 4246]
MWLLVWDLTGRTSLGSPHRSQIRDIVVTEGTTHEPNNAVSDARH